ncbi:MAG: PD-(D/E)XK nuclease family protein, partial [Pseudomonadota bacterium]
ALDAALRGLRPAPGLAGVGARLPAAARVAWGALTPRVAPAFAGSDPLSGLVAACEGLAGGPSALFAGADGAAVADFVASLAPQLNGFPMTPGAFPAFLDAALAGVAVRAAGAHPRLKILGPLEARMTAVDRLILGGLNEDVWPKPPAPDPWLSRGMRARLGLESPEMRIGRQAHDFQQLFCADDVALLRPARAGGAETTPARWRARLDATLRAADRDWPAIEPSDDPRRWAKALHRPTPADRPPAPADAAYPPPEARPRRLSISDVERLMRTPYALYARSVLGLYARDAIDQDPGAAERGTAIHAIVERFVRDHPQDWPANAASAFAAIADAVFAEFAHTPAITALWRPRFDRIANAFLTEDAARRPSLAQAEVEVRSETTLHGLRVVAKADRVDRLRDGGVTIIDYKSGSTPKRSEVEAGLRPQLAVEAAMAVAGAFGPLRAAPEIAYWPLTKGASADRVTALSDPADLAAAADAALARIARLFDDPSWGFARAPHPKAANDPGWRDYAPLAGAPPPEAW